MAASLKNHQALKCILVIAAYVACPLAGQVRGQNCTGWSQVIPKKTLAFAAAYDRARGTSVLFGSIDSPNGASETNEWNGVRWHREAGTNRTISSIAMAYDSVRDVLVIFGGRSDVGVNRRETWEYEGSHWTQVSSTGPQARFSASMCFDASRGVSVLFGGYGSSAPFADTWEWTGNAWTLRSSTGPAARYNHAMVYDVDRGITVLFGGVGGGVPRLGDTWEWDGSNWSQRSVSGPSPRSGHAMVYDAARRETLLYGGNTSSGNSGETWAWDGATWTLRSSGGPAPGNAWPMTFDEHRKTAVLFPTLVGPPASQEIWEWDGQGWTRTFHSAQPSPRAYHGMAFDTHREVTVLFGGLTGTPNHPVSSRETWEWEGAHWQMKATSGPPAGAATLAFDSARDLTVSVAANATWEWNGSTWTTAGSAPSTTGHMMAFDSSRNVMVLFNDSDGWTYERTDGNWLLTATTGPSSRGYGAMAFDAAIGKTVLFGGTSGSDETWLWDGTAWALSPSSGPPNRAYHSMAYDATEQRVVLFGGYYPSFPGPSFLSDTWEFDGVQWQQIAGAWPTPEQAPDMVFDSARGVVVKFGGFYWNGNAGAVMNYFGDTWERAADPRIMNQPANRTFIDGQSASLSIGVDFDARPIYQWRKDGMPLANDGRISGANLAILILNPVQPSDAGLYDVVLTSPCAGEALTSTAASLTVLPCQPCDANCDGSVNIFDINPFIASLEGGVGCAPCVADVNGDGSVNVFDITGFVDFLSD